MDFCFEPDYRAPEESFRALEQDLAGRHDDAHGNRLAALEETLRERLPNLGVELSHRGALAAHAYTRFDIFVDINRGCRLGELTPLQRAELQAIVSGLNEMPRHEGSAVRGINFVKDPQARDLAAAHYEPGKITVEPSITSLSMKDSPDDVPAVEGNVELHVDTTTARRLVDIASNPKEREAVLMPGSQLMVHDKQLVDYVNRDGDPAQKWVIRAEEIAPGDPRYLPQDQAKQLLEQRQEQLRADEHALANRDVSPIEAMLGGGEATAPEDGPESQVQSSSDDSAPSDADDRPGSTKIGRALDPLGLAYGGAHDVPDDGLAHGAQPPLDADGNPDYRQLERSTPPVTQLPAIHGATASPEHHAAYVSDRHPELREVNPNFDQPQAYRNGFQTNCTRCVVAYAERLIGMDSTAEPVLPGELRAKGTLDFVQERLGGEWEPHGSYDDVIQRMSGQPVGSHAVIGVQYETPDGVLGHVALVANTPEGVAFIDPQSGTLMNLPYPPVRLDLLPFGSLESGSAGAGAPNVQPGAEPSAVQDGPAPSRESAATSARDLASAEPQDDGSAPGSEHAPVPELSPDIDSERLPADVPEISRDGAADDNDAPARGEELGEPRNEDPDGSSGRDRDGETVGDRDSAETSDVDESRGTDAARRNSGPWFGQHANPFRPSFPVMEQDQEPGTPATPPAVAPGGDGQAPASPSVPGANQQDTSAPGAPAPTGMGQVPPEVPEPQMPAPGSIVPAGTSAPGGTGGLTRSISGTLDPLPASGAGTHGSAGAALTSNTMPTSARGAGLPVRGDITAGAGEPAPHGPAAGAAGGAPATRGAAQAGGIPGGGLPGAAAAGRAQAGRSSRHTGDIPFAAHLREQLIPAELASRYLRNDDSRPLLDVAGMRWTFRPDGVPGFDGPGELDAGAVLLRFEAAAEDEFGARASGVDLTGRAELVAQDPTGVEELLGTFDVATRSWVPTEPGRRWLADPEHDPGRNR